MLSLILALSVGAGLGVVAPWCFIKVRRRRESKAFARTSASSGPCPATLAGSKADSFALIWTETVKAYSSSKGGGRNSQQPSPTMVLRHGTSLAERLGCLCRCCLRALTTWIVRSAYASPRSAESDNAKTHAIRLDLMNSSRNQSISCQRKSSGRKKKRHSCSVNSRYGSRALDAYQRKLQLRLAVSCL